MNMQVTAIVDLQFGSTGKGALAAYLGEHGGFDAVVHAWGPNAGHTSVYDDGTKCIRTMVSNAAFRSPTIKQVFFGPGSMINPLAVLDEIDENELAGNAGLEYFIHEHASVVLEVDKQAEAAYGFQIGSTMKGTGEALMRKLRRVARTDHPATMGEYARKLPTHPISQYVVSHHEWLHRLYANRNVLAEGCQGYSLGVSSGFWPHCTSRECSLPQLLSDCLLPVHAVHNVIGTCRTYPIRVANRFDDKGNQVGTSGPCYDDQQEIEWSSIGLEPELTTVTKLPRRIFTFSQEQIREACIRNSVNSLFLNFMNYIPEAEQGMFIEKQVLPALIPGCEIDYQGFGPAMKDIVARDGVR